MLFYTHVSDYTEQNSWAKGTAILWWKFLLQWHKWSPIVWGFSSRLYWALPLAPSTFSVLSLSTDFLYSLVGPSLTFLFTLTTPYIPAITVLSSHEYSPSPAHGSVLLFCNVSLRLYHLHNFFLGLPSQLHLKEQRLFSEPHRAIHRDLLVHTKSHFCCLWLQSSQSQVFQGPLSSFFCSCSSAVCFIGAHMVVL